MDASLNQLRSFFQRELPVADIPHPDPDLQRWVSSPRQALREAAVLIPIVRGEGQQPDRIILTVRAAHLPRHAGQISLPGGTREPQDATLVDTALRESHEEVGIPRDAVQILGCLGVLRMHTGYEVTPVVGVLDTMPDLRPCPAEVAEVFTAPLPRVLDLGAYRESLHPDGQRNWRVLELQHGNYRIWGATAVILHRLAQASAGVRT